MQLKWPFLGSRAAWWKFGALSQFFAAAAVTIAISMIALGLVISESMKKSILQSVGEESAATIASVLGPSVQELSNSPTLSQQTISKLDSILNEQLSDRLTAIKIWLRDGTLVYATDKKLIGGKFPSHDLDEAFQGKVSASFDDMDHPENQYDRLLDRPLIEIYAPLYGVGTGKVIAVGEFYSDGAKLASRLRTLQVASAGLFGAILAPMMFLLFLIVRRANATIALHQAALSQKIVEAEKLAATNGRLRQIAEEARLDAGRSGERLLNQIGQDLHDGPIQLLSTLMLRLTQPDAAGSAKPADDRWPSRPADPRSLTARILKEIRDISTGLVLPQLGSLTTAEALNLAVREHEYRTGSVVTCEFGPLPKELPQVVKICLFRAVQETLSNAFQHAGGKDQRVECHSDHQVIRLVVSDRGRDGRRVEPEMRGPRGGLGLTGIERRVEALGGSFEISRDAETGTVARVILPMPSLRIPDSDS
jgi:signal transduction histidine kinase